jgi:hypothetical protein
MRRSALIAGLGLLLLAENGALAQSADSHWPAGAKVFFVEPKDGATIEGPVKVTMGAQGIEIAPAGTDKPGTGHHHILIDSDVPKGEQALHPLPATDQIKHFGKGQTEAWLQLAPGQHTLQLLTGDGNHIPYDPPLASDKITITVK